VMPARARTATTRFARGEASRAGVDGSGTSGPPEAGETSQSHRTGVLKQSLDLA
jgi:hypothetical protein